VNNTEPSVRLTICAGSISGVRRAAFGGIQVISSARLADRTRDGDPGGNTIPIRHLRRGRGVEPRRGPLLTSPPPLGVALIFRYPLQRGLESAHEFGEFDADRVANLFEFKQVQTPRPSLVLAYEGLWVAEGLGNLCLVKALLFSNDAEQ